MKTQDPNNSAAEASRRRWYHFSLLGRVEHARALPQAVLDCPSCNEAAKRAAWELEKALGDLKEALQERIGC